MTRMISLMVVLLFSIPPTAEGSFLHLIHELGLNKAPLMPEVKSQQRVTYQDYQLEHIQLTHPKTGTIDITLKKKLHVNGRKPALLILSGFGTGKESLNMVDSFGDNILVGYNYPLPINFTLGQIHLKMENIKKIFIQIAAITSWLSRHSQIEHQKINVMAISFGTLFLPLAQRIIEYQGLPLNAKVLAYGGVNIPSIAAHELRNHLGRDETHWIQVLIAMVTQKYDPEVHLPFLKGPFLITQGTTDSLFPQSSRQQQVLLTPQPKDVVYLPGDHIHPDKPQLIKAFIKTTMFWLQRTQAIN